MFKLPYTTPHYRQQHHYTIGILRDLSAQLWTPIRLGYVRKDSSSQPKLIYYTNQYHHALHCILP